MFFFLVIIITVRICKFNITVYTQFLLLYYSLWCPGLQRLQRFDYTSGVVHPYHLDGLGVSVDAFIFTVFSIEISVSKNEDPDQMLHLQHLNWVCTVCIIPPKQVFGQKRVKVMYW